MDRERLLSLLLDSWNRPVVFVDAGHVIRYVNRPARKVYARWGDIVGRSIFDCHNPDSCRTIREVFARFREGAKEELIHDSGRHRVYMRAVRDESGELIGYYERYDPPEKKPDRGNGEGGE